MHSDKQFVEVNVRCVPSPIWRLFDTESQAIFRYELFPAPHFSFVSESIQRFTGYSADEHYANPDLIFQAVCPEDLPLLKSMFSAAHTEVRAARVRWRHSAGHTAGVEHRNLPDLDSAGRVVAVEGVLLDISDGLIFEECVRRLQTSDVVSHLSAGAAQDLINVLGVIIGYSDLIREDDAPGRQIQLKLQQINNAAEFGRNLVRQMLCFATDGATDTTTSDVNRIREAVSRLLAGGPKRGNLREQTAPPLPNHAATPRRRAAASGKNSNLRRPAA